VLDTNTVDYGTMPAYTGAVPTKASTAQYSYTFSGWTPVLATVTGDVTYNATFTQTERSYTVTWKNHDGSTLDVDANVGYGVMPHYDGATPVKEGNAQYSYTFTGWSPAVVGVTGDAAYTAQFEEHVNKYTVIWKNWDGTVLETDDLVPYGEMASYDDATPARPATEQYLYTFIGWDAEPSAVTGNVTYTAQFFRATQTYEVIWKNADGTTLETDSSVPFGAVPKYDGAEPTQAADAQYTYTFDKWSPTVSAVTGNITYTAQYSTTVNKYMVTWKNDNGDVLKSEVLAYGAMPTFDGTPAKAATAQYTYTFAGWDNTPAAVTGDATYTATYTSQVNNYTIKWIDWDGTVLKEETLPYGTMPVAPANPTRPEHDGYTFDFLQWDEVITIVTRDVTYQALYTSNAPAYQIVWVDENGNQLHEETHYLDDTPIYPDSDPVKADTVQYTYAFAGWKVMGGGDTLYSSNALPAVTGSVTYQAQFSSALRTYPVTWRNENGTTLMTEQVAYGTVPSYSGATPTKDETDEFTFSFSGWDTEPVAVTGAATYTATYTGAKRSYTVTWQNENGTELAVDTVEYGQMPVYTGATPTKAGTGHYSYVHSGWTPELHPVTRDVTYKATYTMKHNRYTVTWKDEDGTVLRTDLLDYGELPAYGTDPVKTGDAQYSYTFVAWTPSIAAVTRDITYTATYSTQLNRYTVTWKNDNGAVLATEEVEYGTVPTYTGTPAKQATAQYSYTFKGWDNTPVAVTGDVTYTATYSETLNRYTVTWVNWDGTVLETDTDVPYGTTPTYDGADPTRPDTAEHKFTWNLWDKVVSSVTGDVTYQAIFVDRANTYTIVWKNHDGTVLETDKDVPYGAMPSYDGATPVKEGDAQHSYTHSGWTPEVKVVSADAEYTATFEQAGNSYTVTYTDGVDGSEIFADQSYTVAYGTKTPAFDGTPVRAGYTFNGWNPAASETVTKNVIYTAQWTAEAPTIPIEPPVTATGSAKLVKVDADDQSTRLKNVVFELYRSSGVSLGSYITNVNGEITASALVPGDYYWVETRPAEGYVLDSTKHRFTVVDGQTAAITVTNKHSSVPAVFSGDHYAYIVGYSDGTVRPEAYITRAEVATIFFRLLDEQTRDQYYTKENSFSDVERGMWFNTAVSTMASMGIISGYPDGTFHPNANITRAEFAAIAARFDSNGNTTGVSFLDIYDHWAKKEINIAANNGWILGYEDGTFKPNQRITRAEAMAMVNRVLQRIPENKEDLLNSMVKWSDNADTRKWYYLTVQEATNSHDYGRKHNGYEYWIAIREVPDWTKLER